MEDDPACKVTRTKDMIRLDCDRELEEIEIFEREKIQSRRKQEGTELERVVRSDLIEVFPKDYQISINENEGIDLYIYDGRILNVEVKSARELTREKRGDVIIKRTGRFTLKKGDYLHSDFIAFVIKKTNPETLKWNKQYEIFYVDGNEVKDFLKTRDIFSKEQVKISVMQVQQFKHLTRDELSRLVA